jgi:hypothetical protein
VNFVDEQHIVGLKICQQSRKIAGPFKHRSRGVPQGDAHFVRNNVRESGLAQPWRTEYQYMVQGLRALACCANEDVHLRLHRFLTYILGQNPRSDGPVVGFILSAATGGYDTILI